MVVAWADQESGAIPHPEYLSSTFILYHGDCVVACGARSSRRLIEVLFQSLTDGLGACLTQAPMLLYIFLLF
jgi:hypothetical protein